MSKANMYGKALAKITELEVKWMEANSSKDKVMCGISIDHAKESAARLNKVSCEEARDIVAGILQGDADPVDILRLLYAEPSVRKYAAFALSYGIDWKRTAGSIELTERLIARSAQ